MLTLLLIVGNRGYSQNPTTSSECYTIDDLSLLSNISKHRDHRKSNQTNPRVGIYYEVDYQTYLAHNEDVESVTGWIEGLFLEVQAIYNLHNIDLYISEIYIWENPDVYQNIYSVTTILDIFGERLKDDFQGHVAQLCTSRPLGGGKGILGGVCTPYDPVSKNGPYSIATSLSLDTIRNPNFSWSVFLMAHELGHVLGSPHTQACFWGPNSDSSLDDCFVTEGSCTHPTNFTGPGTIMSYCYLQSNGVDFALGLGAEPGAYIYNNLASSSCLDSCEGELCDDNDACTMNDKMDLYCNCHGELLDINKNNICDTNELCDSLVIVNQMDSISVGYVARDAIMNYSESPLNVEVSLSAGKEIQFMPGASIPTNSVFNVYLYGCKE